MPVSEPPPPPVDIQTCCDLVVWRNAPNISYGDITGYDIRLINSAKNREVVSRVQASAMFFSLERLSKTLRSDLKYVQVTAVLAGMHSSTSFSFNAYRFVLLQESTLDSSANSNY